MCKPLLNGNETSKSVTYLCSAPVWARRGRVDDPRRSSLMVVNSLAAPGVTAFHLQSATDPASALVARRETWEKPPQVTRHDRCEHSRDGCTAEAYPLRFDSPWVRLAVH